MGLFSRLFGRKDGDSGAAPPAPETPPNDQPIAIIVLRRGMNVPAADYVEQVIAAAFAGGLPPEVHRVGLSQPSWYKTELVADAIASSVVDTYAPRFGLKDWTHGRRPIDGPDGCACLLIELFD